MQLIRELLSYIAAKELLSNYFPNVRFDASKLVESAAVSALYEIKMIVENDDLSDFDCVEGIVAVLEKYGSCGGGRHDFS